MAFPAFTAEVSAPAGSGLQAWAVRTAVALGADAARFPAEAPDDEAREAAADLRLPILDLGAARSTPPGASRHPPLGGGQNKKGKPLSERVDAPQTSLVSPPSAKGDVLQSSLVTSSEREAPQSPLVLPPSERGEAPEGQGEVFRALETPSLPSPEYLRAHLPPAECNLCSRAMESAFAPWSGPGAESPLELYTGALRRFRVPFGFEHGVRLVQFTQAEDAVRQLESARFPGMPGALEEPIDEVCVPLLLPGNGVPYSALDPDGGWRIACRRLREAMLPATVAARLEPKEATLRLWASNRRREPLSAWVHWRVVRTDGLLLDEGGERVTLEPRSGMEAASVALSGLCRQYAREQMLVWATLETDAGERLSRSRAAFCPPKHLALLDPEIAVEVEPVPARSAKGTPEWRRHFRMLFPGHGDETETRRDGGHWFRVTLTALSPALWVVLSAPGLPGIHFGDNGFDLESESPYEVLVRSERPLTPKAFRAALRSESLFDTYVER